MALSGSGDENTARSVLRVLILMRGFVDVPLCKLDDLDAALPGRQGGTKEAKGACLNLNPKKTLMSYYQKRVEVVQ